MLRQTPESAAPATAETAEPTPAHTTTAAQAEPADERRRYSAELEALLDAAVDAVIIIDHRGRIEVFNRAAERLFGYKAEEIIGQNVSLLMPEPHRRQHDAYIQRYLESGIPHIVGIGREVDAQRRDGTVFPVSLSVGRIAGPGPARFVGFVQDITVRREAVAAAQRERDRANAYLEAAQTILVALDLDGRVTMINRKGCEVVGIPEDALFGCEWISTVVAPEDRSKVEALLRDIVEGPADRAHSCEYHVLRDDGEPRLVAWRCIAVCSPPGTVTGILCSGEDVTEQRLNERMLERTRALLEEAQSIARIGNFEVYLPDGRHDYWSPEAYRICGLDPERDVFNMERMLSMVHPDDRDQALRLFRQSIEREGPATLACRLVLANGSVRHVETRYQVAAAPGGRRRIAGTLHDVTEAVHAAEEARRAQERMTHVLRLATMGEMAAGIAHEINQPLAAITTYCQACERLLERDDVDLDDVREALRQTAAQALRASEIIRRLRSLVRNQDTERVPASINALIEELVALIETDARMHDVRVTFDLAPALPQVLVDRVQIQQVLLNLVRNAIEALQSLPSGRRDITVRTEAVGQEEIEITISDNGPGVDPAILDRMFHPFCTTKPSGTGLGLSISHTIVHAHKGTLSYRANVPNGACFIVRLPVLAE